MNSIDALLFNEQLTDDDKMQSLSSSLRGQKKAGDFFALSSIGDISRAAQSSSDDAMNSARLAGLGRAKEMKRQKDLERQTMLDERYDTEQATLAAENEANRQNKIAIQEMKGGGSYGMSSGSMTAKQQTDLGNNSANLPALMGLFTDDNAKVMGGSGMTLLGEAKGRVVRGMNTGTDKMKASEAQWKTYNLLSDAKIRHELFGSALTPTEEANWNKMTIRRGMSEEVIKAKFKEQRAFVKRLTKVMITNAKARGANQEYIESLYGAEILGSIYSDEVVQEAVADADVPVAQNQSPMAIEQARRQAIATGQAPEDPEVVREQVDLGGGRYSNQSLDEIQAEHNRRFNRSEE